MDQKFVKVICFPSIMLVISMMADLSGCSSSTDPSAVPSAAAIHADVLIPATQYDREIAIEIGQTLLVEVPNPAGRWRIDFGIKHLSLLTPLNNTSLANGNGWLLQALAAGETQVTLTSIVDCGGPQPCPLMPRIFTLTVRVE
jgi:hypothetical protein